MKNSYLKYASYVFYATILAIIATNKAAAIEPSRQELLAQLIVRLGPEKAADFMGRLEKKHTQGSQRTAQEKARPATKKTEPTGVPAVMTMQAPVSDHVTDQPAENITKKQPGFDLTHQERENFDHIVTKLETYAQGIYKCVDGFFNKRNFDPYRHHVDCFKNQLVYLRNDILQGYPHAETSEGVKLFKSLELIAKSLEKSQDIMCTTLDANYGTGMFAGTKLGLALNGLGKIMEHQRAIVDKEIGVIRNQLRNARETEMLKKLNSLYSHLSKNFDYGANKKYDELLSILNHRVKL